MKINIVKTHIFWHIIIKLLDYILSFLPSESMDTYKKTTSILQLTQDLKCGWWRNSLYAFHIIQYIIALGHVIWLIYEFIFGIHNIVQIVLRQNNINKIWAIYRMNALWNSFISTMVLDTGVVVKYSLYSGWIFYHCGKKGVTYSACLLVIRVSSMGMSPVWLHLALHCEGTHTWFNIVVLLSLNS